jgi:hypothetical protein
VDGVQDSISAVLFRPAREQHIRRFADARALIRHVDRHGVRGIAHRDVNGARTMGHRVVDEDCEYLPDRGRRTAGFPGALEADAEISVL